MLPHQPAGADQEQTPTLTSPLPNLSFAFQEAALPWKKSGMGVGLGGGGGFPLIGTCSLPIHGGNSNS